MLRLATAIIALYATIGCTAHTINTNETRWQYADTESTPQAPIKETTAELLKQKSIEARSMLQKIQVGPYCIKKNGKHKESIEGREIALAFYAPKNNKIEIVKIGVCFKSPQNLTTLTNGFDVSWIEGRGITRFSFSMRDNKHDEHILLDKKEWMSETASGEYYFPYSNEFLRRSFIQDGARYLFSEIRQAQEELCKSGAMSRAFPDTRLCKVFPDDIIFNIALIEQIDDEEFLRSCPNIETLRKENRIYNNCAEYAVYKTLVHYARNNGLAFSLVTSSAGAKGAMQFMPKTYSRIANLYSDVGLIRDYDRAVQNLRNMIKAAICLHDLNLASLPGGAADIYKRNNRLGSIYMAAAYNGGLNRAMCLYRHCKPPRRKGWQETSGYIAKYQSIWYIIDSLKEK